jgi:hypothetical protein
VGTNRLETFEFDVGEYHCKARALSIGEWESINEGALPFITAQDKEDIILNCLVEPDELKIIISSGDIPAGIPLLIFEAIIAHSGFDLPLKEREDYLQEARQYVNTSVVESCKALILASGIASLSEIEEMSLLRALERVALAEQVLTIRQQNFKAAIDGGSPVELTWGPVKGAKDEIMEKHNAKVAEVAELLAQQTSAKYGRGARRL